MAKGPSKQDVPLGKVFLNLCRGKNKQEIGEKIDFHRQSISRRITRLNTELTGEQLRTLIIKELTALKKSDLE